MYQTCKTWRNELVDDGFCMRTFSLCRALADGNGPLTLQRVQSTIGRQLERKSDQVETDQAWWLDARSLVQRCNFRVGSWTVWSWLQAASQEPDGPLSRQAASTARVLGQHLVCWPDKPQVRFPGLCTLRGHSAAVNSVRTRRTASTSSARQEIQKRQHRENLGRREWQGGRCTPALAMPDMIWSDGGRGQECTLSVHFILIRVLCHRFLMSLFSVCRSERLVTPVKETASVHAMKMAILRSTMSAR